MVCDFLQDGDATPTSSLLIHLMLQMLEPLF
jgi:hypothetical protein